MGCDIHFYVERRDESGKWTSADPWRKNPYDSTDQDEIDRVGLAYNDHFYHSRNYDLFAILADVRNGRGFAGCDTGDGFVPIAAPRGLPNDVSQEIFAASEDYGGDGHSHSHFTVAELLAYDWTQTTRKRGVVTPAEWAKFKTFGRPSTYSGMVSGGNVGIFELAEFDRAWAETLEQLKAEADEGQRVSEYPNHHLEAGTIFEDKPSRAAEIFKERLGGCISPHTTVEWEVPYSDPAADFLSATMPRLWRLGKPEDVRIVFWFDN